MYGNDWLSAEMGPHALLPTSKYELALVPSYHVNGVGAGGSYGRKCVTMSRDEW